MLYHKTPMMPISLQIGLLVTIVLGAMGYLLNLMAIVGMDFSAIGGEHILRIAGIFLVPLGIIMGFV